MPARLRELLSFVRYLADRFIEDRAPNNAAALTYTTLFAVVPVMTVTFAMLSAIPAFQGTEVQIQAFIFRNFVPSTGATLEEYLRNFIEQARHLTWLGVALLAVTSFFMLVTVEKTFNDIWRVRIPRRGVSSFLLYWAVLSLGPLLLGAGFAMSTYLASVALVFGSYGMSGAQVLLKVTPLLFSIAAFTLMYAAVPNTRVPLRHALIGGALTGVLFEAAKSLFGLYVFYFPGYQLIYGAFATVPLFLVWIYVCWLIVLLGAEVVCSLSTTHHWRRAPLPAFFILLAVLRAFLERQQSGSSLHLGRLHQAGWKLPEHEWHAVLAFLQQERLVCQNDSGHWVLCRDLHGYALLDLLDRAPWAPPAPDCWPPAERFPGDWYPQLQEAFTRLQAQRHELLAGSVAQWLQVAPPLEESGGARR